MTKKQQKIYGIHAVNAALKGFNENGNNTSDTSNCLWIDKSRRDGRVQQTIKLAKQKNFRIKLCSKADIEQRLEHRDSAPLKHQGVLLEIDYRDEAQLSHTKNEAFLDDLLQSLEHPPLLLVLDGVQDPHNLGACLRTADAVGVDAIVIPKDRSVSITNVVRKVACGADQSVPVIQVTNIARTLKLLKTYDIWVVGTAGEAEKTLYEADLKGGLAIVMGAEGSGMRRLTRENCDVLVKIPMLGQVESLNVSVATGVILYEVRRQLPATSEGTLI